MIAPDSPEFTMKASRLLSILMLLQSGPGRSARALAEALEVSQRTILRDIDQLSAAGVPVYAERGREGGFYLREGWTTQLTGMTADEARAVLLSGLPGPAADLGLGAAAAGARLKVLATLPPDWRTGAEQVAARLHVDPADWFRAGASTEHLAAVAGAVWGGRRLCIRYESWGGVADREIEPLGLVLKAGVWYAMARPAGERQARVYRVASILAVLGEGARFRYPRAFDLGRQWREAAQRFEAGMFQGEATVRASPAGVRTLRHFSAAVAQALAQTSRPDPGEPGWVQADIPIETLDHAAHQMLRAGAEVEVLTPRALRERVAALARAILDRYRPRRSPSRCSLS